MRIVLFVDKVIIRKIKRGVIGFIKIREKNSRNYQN
jgi:hypothetical protein